MISTRDDIPTNTTLHDPTQTLTTDASKYGSVPLQVLCMDRCPSAVFPLSFRCPTPPWGTCRWPPIPLTSSPHHLHSFRRIVLRHFDSFPAPHTVVALGQAQGGNVRDVELAFASLRAMQLEPALRTKWAASSGLYMALLDHQV